MTKPFTFLFLATIFYSGNLSSQTWTSHSTGTISDIYDVSFPTIDSGYAVDNAGVLHKTVDGATTWSNVTTPTSCWPIFFITGKIGCIGSGSFIYRTTNGGTTWTTVATDNQVGFASIYFVDAMNGFAGGINLTNDSIRLYKTINGGLSWTFVTKVESYVPDEAFYFFNASTGFWANNFNIFSTTNGGTSFSSVYTDVSQLDWVTNMSFPNIDTGYAIGFSNLLKTVDGGANWTMGSYPGSATYDIHFFDGKKGFACGGNGLNSGYVLQTVDGGTTWTPSYTSTYTFANMDFPSSSVGYVGGQSGIVLKYSGGPTGLSENASASPISVYPNPANGSTTLSNIIPGSEIRLENISGEILAQQRSTNSILNLNLVYYPAGIYFVEIISGSEKTVKKLIVY